MGNNIKIWLGILTTTLLTTPATTTAIALPDTAKPAIQARDWTAPICNNGGKAFCCQGTFAGDLPLIVALAGLTSFPLNPNDINCIGRKIYHLGAGRSD